MADDLRPYGSGGKGLGWYWVKHGVGYIGDQSVGQGLRLIAIDEFGTITHTRRKAEWDAEAPTEEEALLEHLSGAVAEAETNLERYKRQHRDDEKPPPPPPPMDPATRRFFGGDGGD